MASRRGQALTMATINSNLVAAQYAVRGELASRSEQYRARLADPNTPSNLPFESVISANIGNPQQLDQKPLTFIRQVASLVENPILLEKPDVLVDGLGYPVDTIDRAKTLLGYVKSVGAYSQSQGARPIRQRVAEFIERRDGYEANPDEIFLTGGASAGVSTILNAVCSKQSDCRVGVLIPMPQYPLYTATLALLDAEPVPYFLDEEAGWATDAAAIELATDEAESSRGDGAPKTDVRALVVINPGNPTGSTLSVDMIERLIRFAARRNILIIADEVYQPNVFSGQFVSFKKVLRQMQSRSKTTGTRPDDLASVQLVSLHSVSKGMTGECGHRSGYFELVGFDAEVVGQIYKYVSIQLCPSVIGQCVLEMMVNPPVRGDPSFPMFEKEMTGISTTMRTRAYALWTAFGRMQGVECQEPAGAMYLFPTIKLPSKAIAKAVENGVKPDEYYCSRLLDATGICVVPGSGFGQRPESFHFRTTFLAPGTAWTDRWERFHADFMAEFSD